MGKTGLIILVVIVFLILGIIAIYYYNKRQEEKAKVALKAQQLAGLSSADISYSGTNFADVLSGLTNINLGDIIP